MLSILSIDLSYNIEFEGIYNTLKKNGKIQKNQKNSILKNGKKNWKKNSILQHQSFGQIIFFLDSLGCTLSTCIIRFFTKILEHEIFEVKVGTLNLTLFWRISKLVIENEPRMQTSCLKVFITLFLQA